MFFGTVTIIIVTVIVIEVISALSYRDFTGFDIQPLDLLYPISAINIQSGHTYHCFFYQHYMASPASRLQFLRTSVNSARTYSGTRTYADSLFLLFGVYDVFHQFVTYVCMMFRVLLILRTILSTPGILYYQYVISRSTVTAVILQQNEQSRQIACPHPASRWSRV